MKKVKERELSDQRRRDADFWQGDLYGDDEAVKSKEVEEKEEAEESEDEEEEGGVGLLPLMRKSTP